MQPIENPTPSQSHKGNRSQKIMISSLSVCVCKYWVIRDKYFFFASVFAAFSSCSVILLHFFYLFMCFGFASFLCVQPFPFALPLLLGSVFAPVSDYISLCQPQMWTPQDAQRVSTFPKIPPPWSDFNCWRTACWVEK